jgi:hypothetical protein
MMTAPRISPAAPRALALYEGSTMLGTIVERDGKFSLYDIDGRLIGTYPTQIAAMRAIPGVAS